MIRQPASLNRLTVACPIPRLAPVNSRTLRRAAHRAATRRGKLARGSSIPSGSWWMMISAFG